MNFLLFDSPSLKISPPSPLSSSPPPSSSSSTSVSSSNDIIKRLDELLEIEREKQSKLNSMTNSSISPSYYLKVQSPAFNPIDFLNNNVKSDELFDKLDDIIEKCNNEIYSIDNKISSLVHQEILLSKKTIELIKTTQNNINLLYNRINNIKNKTFSSEILLENLFKDIKKLNYGKKNLNLSLNVLKRIQLIIGCIDRLEVKNLMNFYL